MSFFSPLFLHLCCAQSNACHTFMRDNLFAGVTYSMHTHSSNAKELYSIQINMNAQTNGISLNSTDSDASTVRPRSLFTKIASDFNRAQRYRFTSRVSFVLPFFYLFIFSTSTDIKDGRKIYNGPTNAMRGRERERSGEVWKSIWNLIYAHRLTSNSDALASVLFIRASIGVGVVDVVLFCSINNFIRMFSDGRYV